MQDVLSKPQPAVHDQPAQFAQIQGPSNPAEPVLETSKPLPLRSDTMLGVCEALGQDFGFNPNYLRIVLAAMVVWNLEVAFGIYLGLGVVVALSRWLAPAQRPASAPVVDQETHAVPANANAEALSAAA